MLLSDSGLRKGSLVHCSPTGLFHRILCGHGKEKLKVGVEEKGSYPALKFHLLIRFTIGFTILLTADLTV